jgi:hypothetical protein
MEQQETINNLRSSFNLLNKMSSFLLGIVYLILGVIFALVILSVIALLEVNGFHGIAVIIYKLMRALSVFFLIAIVCKIYFFGIKKLLINAYVRRKKNKEEFFKEVRLAIKEEIKNGRRSRSTK